MTDQATEGPAAEQTIAAAPSRNRPAVYVAMADVASELAAVGIGKGRTNSQQNYKFRGIDDVYNVLGPILAANKLVIVPRVVGRTSQDRETKNGGAIIYTVVEVEYDFVSAIDGSKHTARFFGEAMDTSDKSTNKAITAAFKYMCFQVFCIPIEGNEDARDADSTTHEVKARQEATVTALSPQELVDTLDIAPNLDALKATFSVAWKAYPQQSWRADFKAAYDKRKVALDAKTAEGEQA